MVEYWVLYFQDQKQQKDIHSLNIEFLSMNHLRQWLRSYPVWKRIKFIVGDIYVEYPMKSRATTEYLKLRINLSNDARCTDDMWNVINCFSIWKDRQWKIKIKIITVTLNYEKLKNLTKYMKGTNAKNGQKFEREIH